MSKLKICLPVMGLLLLVGMFAHADQVIYDNGAPNQQNGNEMTEWFQSETFTIAQNASITSWTFWDLELPNSGYQGSFFWWIAGVDVNGNPDFNGGIAHGESGGALVQRVQVNGGQCNILGEFCEFMDTIEPAGGPLNAPAGTYTLLLHNGNIHFNQRSEFYWETTNPNATAPGLECDLQIFGDDCFKVGGDYSSNGQEHAFFITGNLVGVPEPGTLMLMGTGLLGAITGLRRRF
jgi:hypothetical protein